MPSKLSFNLEYMRSKARSTGFAVHVLKIIVSQVARHPHLFQSTGNASSLTKRSLVVSAWSKVFVASPYIASIAYTL